MPAGYGLSRRSSQDMRDILAYSTKKWGEQRAVDYVQAFYDTFAKIARSPDMGLQRKKRSHPFLMVEAQKHFIIYEKMQGKVLILTIQHQKRDIESLIKAMRAELMNEILTFQSH